MKKVSIPAGDADEARQFLPCLCKLWVSSDFLQGPRKAIAPVFSTGGSGVVKAFIQAEQLGDHEDGVTGIRGQQCLDEPQLDSLGVGGPRRVMGNRDTCELGEDSQRVVGTADSPAALLCGIVVVLTDHPQASVPNAVHGIVVVGRVGGEGVFRK